MINLKKTIRVRTATQLQEMNHPDSTLPRVEHLFTTPQTILVLLSFPLLLLGGAGGITALIALIWYFKGNPYRVRFKKTNTVFWMAKTEYVKYKQLAMTSPIKPASQANLHKDTNSKSVASKINATNNISNSPSTTLSDSTSQSSETDICVSPAAASEIIPSASAQLSTESRTVHVMPPVTKAKPNATAVIKIAGIDHYKSNIRKAVKAARDEGWYEPFDGYTATDMKEAYRDYFDDSPVYELPQDLFDDAIKLTPGPENEYDPHAIAVQIQVEDVRYTIGYVSKKQLERIHKYVDAPDFEQKYQVITEISGGKSKHVEDETDLYSEESKLRIISETDDLYFNVKIFKK